ncbi:MAG: LamG-like jellyroll fold domain-containing protein [Kiritimatiellia bacterium]|nr:LamG-like jellyroll fold domain-containing protein [Kiritimatiellia bacterium]
MASTFFPFPGLSRPSDEIKTECGGRARIVWCQDAGEGTDAGAQGNSLRLMGLDTDDGKGERCILSNLSNYAKPMLTPDGNKIIFSNRQEPKIYVVGFDGSSLKALADGFALAVWRDSLTGTDWVYAGTVVIQPDSVITNIRRFRLDKPEVNEPVWSKTPLNVDNFQLSASGRYACGIFPWPACGIAALPDREWTKYGDGCWPSLSPDNNLLLWIFDGAHRNLTLFRTKTQERWVVNINNAPGLGGFEVYHPRWSNSALFMVMTGPYKLGTGNNRIRGGGKEVEIYLGRFSADFKKVERWIQVTHNQSADFFPDLWLATSDESAPRQKGRDPGQSLSGPAGSGLQEKKKASADAWPGSFDGLVFFWQDRSKANAFTDPVTQLSQVCRAEAKGRARYGRHFEMAPSGGAFIVDGGAGELVQKCAASGQFAMEIIITPDTNRNEQLLPIVGYAAQSGEWNFLLGQQDQKLVFKLKAAKGGPDYVIPLGALAGGEPSHIIVSCLTSSVTCYLNGEQAGYHDSVFGGRWERGSIVFGNELRKEYAVNMENEKTGWNGLIENVALYSRWIGPEETRRKYAAGAEKIRNRKQIPGLSAKAKLISRPIVPSPGSIAPYRRALAVSHYQIKEIMAGTCSDREIMVAQWVILDGQALHSAQHRKGKTYRLKLELFSDHPELEGERLVMDDDRFDLPLYYDVGN